MHSRVASILLFVGCAFCQFTQSYTDPDNGITFWGITDPVHSVTFGFIFPPLAGPGSPQQNEFIGEIIAPIVTKWAAFSPAGVMLHCPLLLAWPYENTILSSVRYTEAYAQPLQMVGPVLTNLPSTKINSTHWKWVYRCVGCVSWSSSDGSRSLPVDSFGVSAWAWSFVPVDDPPNPRSTLQAENDFGFFVADLASAHVSQSVYDRWADAITG